ncbi:MAG: PEP-CTERM sorting domain-containing protein [Phycisphaerae bacterium]|jgi:hypothetical protein
MKKLITICAVATLVMALSATVQADDVWPWKLVPTGYIEGGAVSYDEEGHNVVVSGRAFYDKINCDGYLGTQLVGGDGINVEVAGNFAMYGVFEYTDTDNVLGWLTSNATTPMAYEIKAYGVNLDLDYDGYDGTSDFIETFKLTGEGTNYLTATFADLGQWGYTQMAPGVLMDIAVLDGTHAALSVVIDGFSNDTWNAAFEDGFNAYLLPGDLGGADETTHGSGIRVMEIPEPATMCLLGLGALSLIRRKK